jgi:hypothetical protein
MQGIRFEVEFLMQYHRQIGFHAFDLFHGHLPAFDGFWDLVVNKPSGNTTQDYGYHAPKRDRNDTAKFKRRMKQDQDRPERT